MIYEESGDLFTITAAMFLRRNPDYWKSRELAWVIQGTLK